MRRKSSYKKALNIACDILLGASYYGIDEDVLFELVMKKYDIVCADSMAKFIVDNLDRFSDDDRIRSRAIKRLGV